jgi:hypothetical protein
MITETDFEGMGAAIAAQNGIPLDLALRYAFLIGDMIELADDGLVIVSDEAGRELARVKLSEGE